MTTNTAAITENPDQDDVLAAGIRDVRMSFDYGNYTDALNACEVLLARRPGHAEALLLLGLISFELEEPQRALLLLGQAHETAPDVREYADALANVNAQLGEVGEALYYAKLATILQPHWMGDALLPEKYSKFFEGLRNANPHLFRNRAQRLLEKGNAADALALCEKQLELTADDIDTWRFLARAAQEVGNIERVLDACEFLSAEEDLSADDYDVLARALAKVGRFADAEQAHRNAIEHEPDNPSLSQSRIRTLAAQYGNTDGHLDRENSAWVAQNLVTTASPSQAPTPAAVGERPLRIGYVGGELYGGPLADLLAPILTLHDPKRVKIYCYAANARYDTASESLANKSARWTDIHGVDPLTVAQILRGDGIDIAVDLSGHGPDNQLRMFAQRPAPICVSWLGTALPAGANFDYQLASEALLPASEPAGDSAANVYRLPKTHLAHRPFNAPEMVAPLPARMQPHLTLGVMAPLAQLGETCVRDWAEILAAIPNARIVVANVEGLKDAAVHRLHELAATMSIRERIDVADLENLDPDGYGFFDHFDLMLDPQPNSRFLETCRALWMGVPVLAVAGTGPLGRQAADALSAADRLEWVFDSTQARIAGISDLAGDLGALADLRAGLRDEIATTALYDVAGFTRSLEDAYHAL
ncbi:MAG: tetratricopeptide repeat protein [Alphaproteobacteria bacterium]|nr:tetratricopeptide repeat protein [Alphaproteobacteria bacterium]